MRRHHDAGDMVALGELAHKLKGTGGTVGFAAFTDPAQRLQQLAEAGTTERIESVLQELDHIAAAIEVPQPDMLVEV
jgi:HPt (histidine-containing phosphotransfer) domain-containing protein